MSAQLIRLLSLCLLALLYIFFARVLHSVWAGVPRVSAGGARRRSRARAGTRGGGNVVRGQRPGWLPGRSGGSWTDAEPAAIVVCSPPEDKGRRHPLDDDVTIGRSADCDVVLDDGYSSETHARLFRRGEQHLLEDLGSTNGTYVNRRRVRSATIVHLGDQIQVGATVFEVMS